MEWRLLGPLEVVAGGTPVGLGGRQRRTLLAVLAVHAGETVSTDRLISELWGDSPPAAARKTVQAHVAHLRRVLNTDGEVLASAGDGYMLQASPEDIDARRFEELIESARRNHQDMPLDAARTIEQALDLFRGAPLAGLADNAFTLRVEAERLTELRLGAIEDRLDALLAAGESRAVAVEAERLVADHPLRERLWGILMLALYRSGQQAAGLRAYSRLRQILTEELGIDPSTELQELEQRMLDHDPALDDGTSSTLESHRAEPTIVRNPYKGLRAFDEADSPDFFGREALVRRLEESLASRSVRLTVLAGPSGAGKSSVVRAGLIPRLRERGAVEIMFPGDDPFASLAKALSEATEQSPDDIALALREGVPVGGDTVIVVDQFEELFTITPDDAVVDKFLGLIAARAQPIRWVVTVRADFLDRLLLHPRLGSLLGEALVLIPPLQEHEVRAVVTGPAERVGLEVEPDLVATVANDVSARPAALPLLQYALTDTFERRRGNELTLADYQRSGGISGALARRAEELFGSLGPDQQATARQLFLQLVAFTEEGELAKRRVERDGLSGDKEAMPVIMERFGAQRLLTFDQDAETGRATVELAHEALMTEWPRLEQWIDGALDDLRMARRLSTAVAEWEDSSRDPSFLLTGARLAEMEGWRERDSISPDPVGVAFLEKSRAAQQAGERSRRTRRRLIAVGLGVAAVVAVVFAVIATNQERIARARGLAAASTANLDTDPELALLLAIEAVRSSPGAAQAETEEALHHAIQAHRAVFFNRGGGAAFISPDGQRVIGGGPADVPVWDIESGAEVLRLRGHTDLVFNAVWSRDGSLIATNSFDRTTRIWEGDTGAELWVVEFENRPISLAFSHDSRWLAVSCCRDSDQGWVRVWDIGDQSQIAELPLPLPAGVNFSPEGRLGVAGDGGISVWDVESGEQVGQIETHAVDVVFSDDGRYLAAAGGSDTVLYDTGSWAEIHRFFGRAVEVGGIDMSSDGRVLATGNIDGTVELWHVPTSRPLATLSGHGTSVINVAFGRDGAFLATGGADDTVRVFDIGRVEGHEWLSFPSLAGDLDAHPDGTLIASAGDGIEVADLATGEPVQELEGQFVRRVQFSPDGSSIAGTGFDGWTRLWETATGELRWEEQHDGITGGIDFSPDGTRILVAGADAFMRDAFTGDLLYAITPYGIEADDVDASGLFGDMLFDLEFSPDGESFATSGSNGLIKMWDAVDGSLIWSQQGHGGFDPRALQVDFSPDGRFLASVGFDGTARVFDTETGEVARTLGTGTGGDLWAIDFSPDGRLLATGGAAGLVTVWEAGTGAKQMTLAEIPETVFALEFSSDGRILAVGGFDFDIGAPEGITRLYLLDRDALVELAEGRLTRWWTPEECATYLRSDECPQAPKEFRGFLPES